MELNKKKEALLASLSISICNDGTLVCDHSSIDIEELRFVLNKNYPEWEDLDDVINCVRWVSSKLDDVNTYISTEYADENVYL